MNRQIVVHPYSGILLSKQKEQNTDTCNDTDELQICYVKVKEDRHNRLCSLNIIPFLWHLGRNKTLVKENRSAFASGWRKRRLTIKEHKGTFEGDKTFHILIMMVVTRLYTFVKTHRIVHWKGWILLFVNYTSISLTFNNLKK